MVQTAGVPRTDGLDRLREVALCDSCSGGGVLLAATKTFEWSQGYIVRALSTGVPLSSTVTTADFP